MLKPKRTGSLSRNVRSQTSSIKKNLRNSKLNSNPLLISLNRAYAEQTDALNRMRGMLEDEMTSKR